MKLKETLQILAKIAKIHNIHNPYICGGVPRDKFMGKSINIVDIDITNGYADIAELAKKFSIALNANIKTLPDGHSSVYFENIKYDFSTNFIVPNVDKYLYKRGITNPTEIQKEQFSRDFTCNTLLMTLDLKKIVDPTHIGIKDIENKLVRTCLGPGISFGYDPNRIVRAIYMAAKLDFDIDDTIKAYVLKNPDEVKKIRPKYVAKKLVAAAKYDRKKTIDLLTEMKIWNNIVIPHELIPEGAKII